MGTSLTSKADEGTKKIRRLEFVGNSSFVMGLEGIAELDPSQTYKVVMLNRMRWSEPNEKLLKPDEILEYLREVGSRRDYVGYIEVPE